jgi:hypothetical protein
VTIARHDALCVAGYIRWLTMRYVSEFVVMLALPAAKAENVPAVAAVTVIKFADLSADRIWCDPNRLAPLALVVF